MRDKWNASYWLQFSKWKECLFPLRSTQIILITIAELLGVQVDSKPESIEEYAFYIKIGFILKAGTTTIRMILVFPATLPTESWLITANRVKYVLLQVRMAAPKQAPLSAAQKPSWNLESEECVCIVQDLSHYLGVHPGIPF